MGCLTSCYFSIGVAVNFVTPADSKFLQETEKFYNTEINEMPLDVMNDNILLVVLTFLFLKISLHPYSSKPSSNVDLTQKFIESRRQFEIKLDCT